VLSSFALREGRVYVNDSGIRPEHIVGAKCKYLCGRVRDGRCHNAVCRSKAAKMQRHGVRWRLPEGGVGSRRWRGLGLYRAHNGALFACNVLRTQVGHVSKWATNPYFPTLKIDYSTTTRWIMLKLKLNIPDISILMLSKFF
jgi:hypothetical protein